MRVLHISDLHVTGGWKSLDEIWLPVAAQIQDDAFDFIVVSGDLSQRAAPAEYANLLRFCSKELVPRVRDRNVARVIVVPGNHDVEWNDEHYEGVPLNGDASSNGNGSSSGNGSSNGDASKALLSALNAPATSDHRLHISDTGQTKLLRIRKDNYPARLSNVQKFLDDFYGTALDTGLFRKFGLHDEAREWSCHPFLDQDVVFIGMSSCNRNDKYWHGASFSSASVSAAAAHLRALRKHNPRLLAVAVWHHGFDSSAGRPDRLSLADAGLMFGMGARLGLHGHTHVSDSKHVKLLNGRMPVIATGSLAAGMEDRPDGTPNQFCVLDLHPTRVSVEVFRLDHRVLQYHKRTEDMFKLGANEDDVFSPATSCSLHRRVYSVNTDGVEEVAVELKGLRAVGVVPLTLVCPPYCAVKSAKPVQFDNRLREPHEQQLPEGKYRYSVSLDPEPSAKKLSWSYFVSNAVALTHEELSLLPERKLAHPNIDIATEDACSYTVRFDCEKLELQLRFQNVPMLAGARVLVEQRSQGDEDTSWEPDNRETDRVAGALSRTVDDEGEIVLDLSVPAPIVGRRYSLVFSPGNAGNPYPAEARYLASTIIEHCREKSFGDGELGALLTEGIDDALTDELGEPIGEWVAHLWHAKDRALLPAFGRFSAWAWTSYFEAGTGVVGHAFRHCNIVGWTRDEGARTQTIYRPQHDLPGRVDPGYNWVLCIPLQVSADGPAIGIVGIARDKSVSMAERRCERYVRNLRPDWIDQPLRDLRAAINITFWTLLGAAPQLLETERNYALKCLRQIEATSESPRRPKRR